MRSDLRALPHHLRGSGEAVSKITTLSSPDIHFEFNEAVIMGCHQTAFEQH